jgi:integrase
LEPHNSVAARQGSHGRCECLRYARLAKGLRHGFGVNAFQSLVPPYLVQRWMGHASPKSTAIYGDVMGSEERAFAERMWK